MKRLLAFILAFAAVTTIAPAASVLAPSGILAHPAKFDRQSVTVLGIAQNVVERQAGPGTVFTQYQLCDSMCVNVINVGPPKVVNGQNATISGTFHTFFVRGPVQARNIIVVQ
jgi:hypothetical protein